MCGVFHNRSRLVMTLIFIPLLAALLSTEAFFDFVGFDPEASYYSQIYINRMIPGLYLGGLVDSNRRLLNSMGYQYAPMII
jgi:Na+-driven multidrug efflux pump